MNDIFKVIAAIDFEYEVAAGGSPVVLCLVAYVLDQFLRHVQTIRLWRDDFGSKPPFDIGPDALIVAYSAWAEMTCFLQLGWPFPEHVLDLHTAYLAASNVLEPYAHDETKRKKLGKSLPVACRAYGIEGWERFDKSTIAEDIGAGNWGQWGRETVFDYCEEDVRKTVELLCAQLRGNDRFEPIDVSRTIHWSNYSSKSVALVQARGMRIDMDLWNLVQENKEAVVAELIRRFDPSYGTPFPIYTPEGEWSYDRFERWLAFAGARAWPRLDTGRTRRQRRRLPSDVQRPARRRGIACAARFLGLHRKGSFADWPGRPQSPIIISIWNSDRQKRAREKPLQRTRRHAVIHEVRSRRDRLLSRLALAGSRRRRGPVQ